jgi:hypothetical protein
MTQAPIVGLPGPQTARTATPRRVKLDAGPHQVLPSNIVIDGSLSRDPLNTGDVDQLRAGMLLGKITSGGLYRPSIIGVTTVAHTGNSTVILTVAAGTATEVNRLMGGANISLKITGPPTAAGTVASSAITVTAASGTSLTLSAVLTTDFVVGSLIQPAGGSETPLVIIGDGYPIKVTDADAASIDQNLEQGRALIGGAVDASQIANWPADASLKNWVMSKLNGGAAATPAKGPVIFDHPY